MRLLSAAMALLACAFLVMAQTQRPAAPTVAAAADRPNATPPDAPRLDPPAADLAGLYRCENPAADRAGHVVLVQAGKGYRLRWYLQTPAKVTTPHGNFETRRLTIYEGYAERKGDALTAAWTDPEGPALGLSHYRIGKDSIAGEGETWTKAADAKAPDPAAGPEKTGQSGPRPLQSAHHQGATGGNHPWKTSSAAPPPAIFATD